MELSGRFKYMLVIATQHDIRLAVSPGARILSSHPRRGTTARQTLNHIYAALGRHRPRDGPTFRPRLATERLTIVFSEINCKYEI